MTYQKPENAYENAIKAIAAMKELPPYPTGKGSEFTAKKMMWRDMQVKQEREFRDILEAAYATAEHPKADLLLDLAWCHGHSYGFQEVLGYYEEFSDLLS